MVNNSPWVVLASVLCLPCLFVFVFNLSLKKMLPLEHNTLPHESWPLAPLILPSCFLSLPPSVPIPTGTGKGTVSFCQHPPQRVNFYPNTGRGPHLFCPSHSLAPWRSLWIPSQNDGFKYIKYTVSQRRPVKLKQSSKYF